MEARKKYYTFSQALEKIMEDPNNLVMTRTPYISEGPSVIRELLPNVESDFPDKPILVRVDSTGLWEYFPTQEDMHSMTWMVLRNGVKPYEMELNLQVKMSLFLKILLRMRFEIP
jgi:hypothetical protein